MSHDYDTATSHLTPRRPGLSTVAPLVALAVVATVAFIFYTEKKRDPREAPYELVGEPAPTFTLRRLDTGAPLSFEQMRGRPVVVNFWASWCGPCRAEHGVLHWAAKTFGQQVQFVGIVYEDSEPKARAFLKANGVPFPEVVDPESRIARAYGVTGVPETFFIDSAGNIHGKHIGPITQEAFIQAVKGVLGEEQAP
ncbi:MAG: redoxin domain-containing protein [Deltaproteobacteria bacterium]|nr:redoxin domain-containing protein [Deltaproteobacteria bacterium]